MGVPAGSYDNLDSLNAGSSSQVSDQPPAPAPFDSKTIPPSIIFTPTGGPSASMQAFYLTPDDNVQLTVWNGNAALTSVTLQLRILRPDGTIVITAATLANLTSNRTANTLSFSQLEGFLVGAVVGPPGVALASGQTFCNLAVVRGTPQSPIMSMVLLADYLTSATQPGWPYGRVASAVDGPGFVKVVNGAIPNPNTGAVLTQPAGTRWRVTALRLSLATDATAGNRLVSLDIAPGAGLTWKVSSVAAQPPSSTYFYSYAAGVNWQSADPTQQVMPIPPDLVIANSSGVNALFSGGGAGDQMSAITAQIEEWIDV